MQKIETSKHIGSHKKLKFDLEFNFNNFQERKNGKILS